jgi:hypothetical protein
MLTQFQMLMCVLYSRKESTYQHHEEETRISADNLDGIRNVKERIVCGRNIESVESSQDELLFKRDRIGLVFIDKRDDRSSSST